MVQSLFNATMAAALAAASVLPIAAQTQPWMGK